MGKELSFMRVTSLKDMAELLKTQNKTLNDITIAFYHEGDQESLSEEQKIALRFMRQETSNSIGMIQDKAVAEKMKIEPGKFYVYYKPSYVNGFEKFIDRDINFDFLQAYEAVCRDEFTLNSEFV